MLYIPLVNKFPNLYGVQWPISMLIILRYCNPILSQMNQVFRFTPYLFKMHLKYVSRDSPVGIATAYGLDDGGVGVESLYNTE
jgi:hypothetical protein